MSERNLTPPPGADPAMSLSPAMQRGGQLLQAGKPAEADELMHKAAAEAADRFGQGSLQHRAALNEQGMLLVSLGQLPRAVDVFAQTCDGPMPMEGKPLADRLTYLMNYGQALAELGRLDEAERILRLGIEGRAKCYGKGTAGYAFGLEPLAMVMLDQGKPESALAMVEETSQVFRQANHPRLATSLVLRAEALKALDRKSGKSTPAFTGLASRPREFVEEIAALAIARVGRADPMVCRAVLADVLALAEHRLGQDHPMVVNLLATTANVEGGLGKEGNAELRQKSIRRAIAAYDRQNRPEQAVNATMGLALAQAEAGQIEEAIATYEQAGQRAELTSNPGLRAQVRRNLGLMLRDNGRPDEAEANLRQALEFAGQSSDRIVRSRIQVALGVTLQHAGKGEEARPLLESALAALNRMDRDAMIARGHLSALQLGQNCGCDGSGREQAEAFRQNVASQLPEGFLKELNVEWRGPGQDLGVSVMLNQKPTPEQLQQMNQVISKTIGEFREKNAIGKEGEAI